MSNDVKAFRVFLGIQIFQVARLLTPDIALFGLVLCRSLGNLLLKPS